MTTNTNVEQAKPVSMAASIPGELAEFVEDFRWGHRQSRSQVLIQALTEWAERNGYGATETPDEAPVKASTGKRTAK